MRLTKCKGVAMMRTQSGESVMPLYSLTSPEGKQYVGITAGKLVTRMHRHRAAANSGSPYPIHAAIRKYGFPAFKVEVLNEECDMEKLNHLEMETIAQLNTVVPNGYNLTIGGDGNAGAHSSERTRRMWQTFSADKRAEVVSKMGDASRKFWGNVSAVELEEIRTRGANGARSWWANATAEQLEQRAQAVVVTRSKRSDEDRARTAELCGKAASGHWAGLSDEEAAAHAVVRSSATKKTWANLTSEQRAARGAKMSAGRKAAIAAREAGYNENLTAL